MKEGDVVMIFEDPLTQTKPEGKAKLIKLLKDDIEMQYWRVEFSEGFQGNRWIKQDLREFAEMVKSAYNQLKQEGRLIAHGTDLKDLWEKIHAFDPKLSLRQFKDLIIKLNKQDFIRYELQRSPELMVHKRYAIKTTGGYVYYFRYREEDEKT